MDAKGPSIFAVTAFVAVRSTSQLAEMVIRNLSASNSFTMPQITVLPFAGCWSEVNAFFTPNPTDPLPPRYPPGPLRGDCIVLPVVQGGASSMFVAASFDIVAHETGHSVLHNFAIFKEINTTYIDPAINEHFADFMVILHLLRLARAQSVCLLPCTMLLN